MSLSSDNPCGRFIERHLSVTSDDAKIAIAYEEVENDSQLRARNCGTGRAFSAENEACAGEFAGE